MMLKIVQNCEPGKKHKDSLCQDSCSNYEDNQWKIMALCDGTSDAEFSDFGSKCVAEFSVKYMKKHFDSLWGAEFSEICETLTDYHQQLLLYLSQCTEKEKGISIVVNRQINNQELRRFCTTIQIVALKNEKGIYYKVGNGAAIIANRGGTRVLSDSSMESPTKHITLPNTLTVLSSSEFKCFEFTKDDYAVVLMTDGVEYSHGLFYNHEIKPAFEKLLELIRDKRFSHEELKNYILDLENDSYNTVKDDIGISIIYDDSISSIKEERISQTIDEKIETSTFNQNVNSYMNVVAEDEVLEGGSTKKVDSTVAAEYDKMCISTSSEKDKIIVDKRNDYQDYSELGKNAEKKMNRDNIVSQKTSYKPAENQGKKKINVKTGKKVLKGQAFYKKIIIHLLLALIIGLFIGGFSTSAMLTGKIRELTKRVEQLSDSVNTMSTLIEELKQSNTSDNIFHDEESFYRESAPAYVFD